MIVLDTHVWIWMRSDPTRIPHPAATAIAGSPKLAVSVISCWELATLVRSKRIALDRDVDAWTIQALAAQPTIDAVELSVPIALAAGKLNERFPGDPGDRMIFATSRLMGCPLVTADDRIRRYSPETTIWD